MMRTNESPNTKWDMTRRSYTFKRRPVKLVYCAEFGNVDEAIAWEKQIKGWSRAKKVAFISENWELLHDLAKRTQREAGLVLRLRALRGSAQDDKREPRSRQVTAVTALRVTLGAITASVNSVVVAWPFRSAVAMPSRNAVKAASVIARDAACALGSST